MFDQSTFAWNVWSVNIRLNCFISQHSPEMFYQLTFAWNVWSVNIRLKCFISQHSPEMFYQLTFAWNVWSVNIRLKCLISQHSPEMFYQSAFAWNVLSVNIRLKCFISQHSPEMFAIFPWDVTAIFPWDVTAIFPWDALVSDIRGKLQPFPRRHDLQRRFGGIPAIFWVGRATCVCVCVCERERERGAHDCGSSAPDPRTLHAPVTGHHDPTNPWYTICTIVVLCCTIMIHHMYNNGAPYVQ